MNSIRFAGVRPSPNHSKTLSLLSWACRQGGPGDSSGPVDTNDRGTAMEVCWCPWLNGSFSALPSPLDRFRRQLHFRHYRRIKTHAQFSMHSVSKPCRPSNNNNISVDNNIASRDNSEQTTNSSSTHMFGRKDPVLVLVLPPHGEWQNSLQPHGASARDCAIVAATK